MIKKDKLIVVATHKEYRMPDDDMYLPVFVNTSEHKGYVTDGTGENISAKNFSYCELTALYWAWKNTEFNCLGLVHYRRYFKGNGKGDKFSKILTSKELDKYLATNDILVPKKRHYYIETNESQYLHAHHSEGLDAAKNVVTSISPKYDDAWNTVMHRRSGHRFNMFIMKKRYADEYCEWLFGVLAEIEKKLDISDWSVSEKRVYGYLAERLLDVWLTANEYVYAELPYMFMEKQHWIKKIGNFLKRKFGRKSKE